MGTQPQLSFDRTVSCAHAHRRALSEVFVADSVQTDQDEFAVAVQVPRAHTLWFDRTVPFHDPLAMVEAGRQGTFVVVHRHVGVPLGLPASLQRIDFAVHALEAFRDDQAQPLEGIFSVRLADHVERDGFVTSLSFRGELAIDGAAAMSMGGELVFLPRDDYETLRAMQRAHKRLDGSPPAPPEPVDPAAVGRIDRRNVVVGDPTSEVAGRLRLPVRVDQTHPAFFDHPQDHLPGPLIVEACRQSALLAATRADALPGPEAAVTRCQASFTDFAEFEAEVACATSVTDTEDDRPSVEVALVQFGVPTARADVQLTRYPRR